MAKRLRSCDNGSDSNFNTNPSFTSPPPPLISSNFNTRTTTANETNTAKLPIETVKKIISAISKRPLLWARTNSGQKRCSTTSLWFEVSKEVELPADLCRIKWGHLRDNFRKVFIRNTLSGQKPTTWRFYNDMRFMEEEVAQNVIRQNRYRTQSASWCDPTQMTLSNPFPRTDHFADQYMDTTSSSSFFKNDISANSVYDNSLHGSGGGGFPMLYANSNSNGADISNGHSKNELDEDDEFDEDAATDENDTCNTINNNDKKTNDIFTIEVFDDDDEEEGHIAVDNGDGNKKMHPTTIKEEKSSSPIVQPYKNIVQFNAATNTESNGHNTSDTDSDRLFLLSLLPFLRQFDGQRNLRVRQKLQNVFIDEFG